MNIVEGKALKYLTFEEDPQQKTARGLERSPKQHAYAEVVESAVKDLLASKHSPKELQNLPIEIVQVDIADSLTSATVVWKIPVEFQCDYTAEEVESILKRNLLIIRFLLPAHSTVTQTPAVQFVYDKYGQWQRQIEQMLEKIRMADQ